MAECEHLLIVDAVMARNVQLGEDALRMHIERARVRFSQHTTLFDR
jgi:DNA-binding GntR family transcriptional regulator